MLNWRTFMKCDEYIYGFWSHKRKFCLRDYFDVYVTLTCSFTENKILWTYIIRTHFLPFIHGDCPFILEVSFVSDNYHFDVMWPVIIDALHPSLDVGVRRSTGDVIEKDRSLQALQVGTRQFTITCEYAERLTVRIPQKVVLEINIECPSTIIIQFFFSVSNWRNVVFNFTHRGTSEVGIGECSEPLLSCSIPG